MLYADCARLIRYADDFVVCFECQADAERFRAELGKRLGQVRAGSGTDEDQGDGVWPRFAVENAKQAGDESRRRSISWALLTTAAQLGMDGGFG